MSQQWQAFGLAFQIGKTHLQILAETVQLKLITEETGCKYLVRTRWVRECYLAKFELRIKFLWNVSIFVGVNGCLMLQKLKCLSKNFSLQYGFVKFGHRTLIAPILPLSKDSIKVEERPMA